jgi:hypothetical protein
MDNASRSGAISRIRAVLGRRRWHVAFATIALVAARTGVATPAAAAYDPNRTVTVFVPGFDESGAHQHGVYGVFVHRALADTLAALAGLPAADTTGGPIPPNAVCAMEYYGDTAPDYYTAADRAEVDRLTATWGGGVPRYAYIVARLAQRALERSGAAQVNMVSGSFGSLIVRWMIEHDVAGLAHSGSIARWLSIEGVVAGNWAASRGKLVDLVGLVQPQPIDVTHMTYDWVSANLHTPRTEGDSPYYAGMLLGQVASTADGGLAGPLTALMLAYKDYLPNDGVQAAPDARFTTTTAQSRLLGLPPTTAFMHSDHLGIKDHRGAYAEATAFLTGRRRVTVMMTSARVVNLHEIQLLFWDWRPAEVVFENRVHSPSAESRWRSVGPISERLRADAAAPLHLYQTSGETQALGETVFDDLVLPEETELRIDLHAFELDYDPRYQVFETLMTPYDDDMGGGTVVVSTLAPGTYSLNVPDWSCELAVSVFDYPFAALLDVPAAARSNVPRQLVFAPNPTTSSVRITLAGYPAEAAGETARLEIVDVSGRLVRVLEGAPGSGFAWDGRGAGGTPLPAGVYLHRVITPRGVWTGRSCILM